MIRNPTLLLTSLAAALLIAGCSSSDVTAPPAGADSEEMIDVALDADSLTETVVMSEFEQLQATLASEITGDPITRTHTFSATHVCPEGGLMSIDGSITMTLDPAAGSVEAELTGTRTRADCTFRTHGGTVSFDGTANWDKFRRAVNGQLDGLQTSHYFGSWTSVHSNGRENACSHDYTVTRDPANHTLTFEGTACGHPLGRSIAWNMAG